MKIVDVGSGPPLVIVPGIQGRWEWMRPGVEALARRCRVITFSLADEPTCRGEFHEEAGFSCYVQQVASALDQAGIERAVICGVSYGGLIAAAFAATHPGRASGLVLVSALPPSWVPDERVRFYLRAPRLLSPLFAAGSLRMYREIAAAATNVAGGLAAAATHGFNVLAHMFSPRRMARRVTLLESVDLHGELAGVELPTLVVTGDPRLDRVVPVGRTREYLDLWPHAEYAMLPNTGHLGLITRPEEFAGIVAKFVHRVAGSHEQRRRVV